MAFKVTSKLRKLITNKIEDLFKKIKSKILGIDDKDMSLSGVYSDATKDERAYPNLEVLDTLIEQSSKYLDALEAKSVNLLISDLENSLSDKYNTQDINAALNESWQKITSNVESIVTTQVQTARNFGLLNGINRVNTEYGIEDPLIYFVTMKDGKVCDECTRLHICEDGITPKVWKLSELSSGFHKKGGHKPAIIGLHPHCRCTISTLLPGYGFKNGKVAYISKNHDEFKEQRG